MRRFALVALALMLGAAIAGCSDDPKPTGTTAGDDPFGDDFVEPEPTATTGVILGVVVDEAIRPVAEAKVGLTLPDGTIDEKTTDTEGRFAYGDLDPGTYLLQVSHLQYTTAQTSVEVVAGDKDPPVHKILIERLFDREPYHEMIQFDGYLACAYAVGVSSTCVNDYTRVVGCLNPSACVCPGGCFRDQNLSKQGGNLREYVSSIGPGWQTAVWEMVWEPTSDLGKELGLTVSYYSRPTASHFFGGAGGPSPVRLQIDVGVEHESANLGGGYSTMIPENGTDELFTFFSAAGGTSGPVAVNQQFQAFQTHFYYGIIPEGWSFVNGDPFPF